MLHIKPFFDQHKESLDLLLNLHLHAFNYISASFRDSRSMTYPGSNLGAHESRHMHLNLLFVQINANINRLAECINST